MDLQQAMNALSARYTQVAEALQNINRWREAATADIHRIATEIQNMAKANLDRERLLAGIKADNKTLQGQLRSVSAKVDELSRRVRTLEEHLSPPDLKGGHPGLPYINNKGEVA